jgi:hypothetical protein
VQLAELWRLAAEHERGGAGSVVEREQLSGAVEHERAAGARRTALAVAGSAASGIEI